PISVLRQENSWPARRAIRMAREAQDDLMRTQGQIEQRKAKRAYRATLQLKMQRFYSWRWEHRGFGYVGCAPLLVRAMDKRKPFVVSKRLTPREHNAFHDNASQAILPAAAADCPRWVELGDIALGNVTPADKNIVHQVISEEKKEPA